MADPFVDTVVPPLPEVAAVPLPPAPRPPRSKAKSAAAAYVPDDPIAARQRLKRSRATRARKEPKVNRNVQMPAKLSRAVDDIMERFDVGFGDVMRRFIKDGIAKYAPDLAEAAGAVERENPFAGLPTPQTRQTPRWQADPNVYDEVEDPAAGLGVDLPGIPLPSVPPLS